MRYNSFFFIFSVIFCETFGKIVAKFYTRNKAFRKVEEAYTKDVELAVNVPKIIFFNKLL